MTTTDTDTIADELLGELNLDASELSTIRNIVQASAEIVSRSSDASTDDKLTIPAIKTLATAMYYDRNLSNGMPNGLIMLLTHLQATPANPPSTDSGDSNGN